MQQFTILSSLKHRPFQILFAGQVISNLGDWLDYLAIVTIIVYQWHLGAPALAAFTVAMFLPLVVIGPFAGVWVDRWPRRSTMIICDLVRAGLVIGLIWAPNFYVVLLIVILVATMSTFFSPAEQAAIRMTVPEDALLSANSLSQLSLQATKILGPAIGGVIVLWGGIHIAFVVDSLSFLASAVLLSRLPPMVATVSGSQEAQEESKHFWKAFRAGFVYVFQKRMLITSIASVAIALFIVFTFDALGPIAIQSLGLNASILGLAIGSIGLGTAVGAIAIGQWGQRIPSLRLMAFGDIVAGALVAVVGSAILIHLRPTTVAAIAVAIIIWLIMGVAAAAMVIPYGYILQKETPPSFMGRVSSVANGLQTALQLLAPVIGAVIAVNFGVGVIFAIAGIALTLLGGSLLFVRLQSNNPKSGTSAEASDDLEVKIS